MKEKTKYRIINNGYFEWLQYLKETKFLFFFTYKKWHYVWKPYYDKIKGRDDILGYDTYINNSRDIYSNSCETHIKRYPYIEEYFKWANARQAELVAKASAYWKKIESNRSKIKYY